MLEFVPILSVSAKEGLRVHRVVQEIRTVYNNCRRVLGRDRLAQVFAEAMKKIRTDSPIPSIKLLRACQIMVEPPVIDIETKYLSL
jgi:GTP-binding protein